MKTSAKVITPDQVSTLRTKLPSSWTNAIGILKAKKIDPVRYQRKIRGEWDQRLKRQIRLARHGS